MCRILSSKFIKLIIGIFFLFLTPKLATASEYIPRGYFVIDLKNKDKDKVFVFNDWTFASSPSIRPFDHPVYDIWLKKCYS